MRHEVTTERSWAPVSSPDSYVPHSGPGQYVVGGIQMFCVQTFTYLNQVSMSATNDKQVSILSEVCFDDCQFTHSWGSFSITLMHSLITSCVVQELALSLRVSIINA